MQLFKLDLDSKIVVPFFPFGIKAGFPSPATDYLEETIDLKKELIRNPSSTFLGRAVGDSMVDDGIEEGDVLIIDKSLPFESGKRVLAYYDGGFTVKRLLIENGKMFLVPGNKRYKPIEVTGEVVPWGVVTYIIKKCWADRFVCTP